MRRFSRRLLFYGVPLTLALAGIGTVMPPALMGEPLWVRRIPEPRPAIERAADGGSPTRVFRAPRHRRQGQAEFVVTPVRRDPAPALLGEDPGPSSNLIDGGDDTKPTSLAAPAPAEETSFSGPTGLPHLREARAALRELHEGSPSFEEQRAAIAWAIESEAGDALVPELERLAAASPDRRIRQCAIRALKKIRRHEAPRESGLEREAPSKAVVEGQSPRERSGPHDGDGPAPAGEGEVPLPSFQPGPADPAPGAEEPER